MGWKILNKNNKVISLLKQNFNLDIRNYSAIERIFKKFKKNIALIIHCAAQPSHDYGKDFPIIDFTAINLNYWSNKTA